EVVSYPQFTEEEEKAYTDLMNSSDLEDYVEAHPGMTENQISAYADTLYTKYKLEKRVLRKLIRNQVERANPTRLYDLDYDLQLNEALKIVASSDFNAKLQSAKTLKEMQTEAPAEKTDAK
ncbi:MAG TPA: peptidase S41, partial [Treponema sp.]|nr:peptidase S41 [Treponema sp.]